MRVLGFLILFLLASCSSGMNAKRVSTEEGDKLAMSVTDNWLATDTKMAVQEALKQIQNHKGYQRYLSKIGKQPKVFIAEVQNNTSNPYFPIQDLNDELLYEFSSSGDYILVDEVARDKLLNEIKYQNDGMVDSKQAKSIGKQSGADLMIFGTVNMKPEMYQGKTVKEYSVNMRITDIENGVEVCRTRYKTTKYSERDDYAW